jgi:Lauroyl/myristoyl acyltransferase
MADFEYLIVYHIIKYRRKVVNQNITTAFPNKSKKEIKHIEKGFYHWFADYFFEAVKLLSISDSELRRRFKTANSEEVEKCFQEGQDVATILGHYCNWEWLSCVGIDLPKSRVMR